MNEQLAAVDLGSNSFRLSIGRLNSAQPEGPIDIVLRLHEPVHLAQGLNSIGELDDAAIGRATKVLRLFRQHLKNLPSDRILAVATNTFRIAKNANTVLKEAEQALGHPIEIISGLDEARLIYKGVSYGLKPSNSNRLIIDIGGGSTEVVLGHGTEPLVANSLALGCATLSQRFFPNAKINATRLELAQLAAQQQFKTIAAAYNKHTWATAYGSSGTAKGVSAILQHKGWAKGPITESGLNRLRQQLIRDKKVVVENLPGIKPTRVPVLPGGLAILLAAFQVFDLTELAIGDGALRQGVLCELQHALYQSAT